MKFTNFIAKRYLFERKKISLISTLTLISISGVTLGTALLIIVLSVFNGFFDVIKQLLLSYDPDIRIEATTGRTMNMNEGQIRELERLPEIKFIAPYASGRALLTQRGKRDAVVEVKGIHTGSFFKSSGIEDNISRGNANLQVQNRKPGLIMSDQLMAELRLSVGDAVTLVSAAGMEKSLTQFTAPNIYRFDVRGSYTIKKAFDQAQVFVDLKAAQRIFNYRRSISGLDIMLQDHTMADQVKQKLKRKLGSPYKISTWYDLQKPLYDVMNLEKWGAFFILMIIILVAILNIVGSLTMIVIQKKRDIGILRTMGCTRKRIKQIFLHQGLQIGLIGCVAGGVLGLILCWLQAEFGVIGLSDSFIISAYPVSVRILDVTLILGGSLSLCVAAGWYPSNRAAAIVPAQAIRYE